MPNRRNFLAANLAGAAAFTGTARARSLLGSQAIAPQEHKNGRSNRDYWTDWPAYLTKKMNDARRRRLAVLASIRSAAQARERAEHVRTTVWKLIGGPLERTPLNPRLTGTIDRGAYRIEKVIFESLPQVYVTANLYVPGISSPPFPAIVAPLGHIEDGKTYRNYQYTYQNLARKGFVVLALDPYGQGERLQYLDPKTGQSRYGPTGEHDEAGRPLILLNNTFALYRAWDAIRAVDYLTSRPEVDVRRLGCTGHSGGGTMTMYLCALEPRLRAAVPVDGNCEDMAGPFYDPPGAAADAEQNLVGGLPLSIDRGDLLLAFAPKPLLVCYTTHDEGETYSPLYEESLHEIYRELQRVYSLFGARDKVAVFASHLPHDMDFFNRRATYGWFNRWLGSPAAGVEEAAFDASPPGALDCTSTGQVLTSLGGRSIEQVTFDRARQTMPASLLRSASTAAALTAIRGDLKKMLTLPTERSALNARVLNSENRKGILIEEIEFESEPGVRIPGWFAKPAGALGPYPTVLYIDDRGGADAVAEPSSLNWLFARHHAVCAINVRGLGISAPRFPKAGPQFYGHRIIENFAWACLDLGHSAVGQRTWDVLRGLDYLASRPEINSAKINIFGVRSAGLAALMASVLDDRAGTVFLHRTLVSYAAVLTAETYSVKLDWLVPGILCKFDLPDLVAALSPRPCGVLNAIGPAGEVLPVSAVMEHYAPRIDPSLLHHVAFLVQPERNEGESYVNWLLKVEL